MAGYGITNRSQTRLEVCGIVGGLEGPWEWQREAFDVPRDQCRTTLRRFQGWEWQREAFDVPRSTCIPGPTVAVRLWEW